MVLLAKLVAEDTPAQYPKSAGIPASSLPPSLLVYPHPPTRLHQRSLHRRVGASSRWRRVAYSGSVSQWVASPFNAASSPTSAERSRAVSPTTSLGACGPTYEPPNMRRHQDLGSERFRGLSSWAEGVSLPIDFMCSSRTGAPRTGLRLGKLGRMLRSFSRAFRRRSESSVIRSSVDCICSRCSSICCSRLARTLRGHGNTPSYSPNTLRRQLRSCGLCAPS
jgi:hypothetical protein